MSASKFHKPSIDHTPVSKKSIIIFFIFFCLLIILIFKTQIVDTKIDYELQTLQKSDRLRFSEWDIIVLKMQKRGYNFWKIAKVTNFLKNLTPIVLERSLKKGMPPAAVLSIACLESGYGTGYIGNVSGNILSLNAHTNEPMLPPLKVAITKENEVMIDMKKIQTMLASGYEFKVIERPPSYKKDYRPLNIAGSKTQLDYFLHHPDKKYLAWEKNVDDLMFSRVILKSKVAAYKESAVYCEDILAHQNLSKLISNHSAIEFICLVGGRPYSYNIRISWRDKVVALIDKLGLEHFLKLYIKNYKDYYDLKDWIFNI